MVGCGTVVLLIASQALAAPALESAGPVRIALQGAARFSGQELEEALAARLPADTPAGELLVVARADGAIELSWQGRRRVVDVGEESGPTAARVVALLAADLLLPLGLPPPTVELPRPPRDTAPPPAPVAHESEVRAAVHYQTSSGVAGGPFLQGLEVSAGLERRVLRLAASAGYLAGQANSMVDLTAWPLRLGAGAGVSFGSLLGSVVVVPYHVDGVASLRRSLVGLGVDAQVRFPMGRGFAVEASAGYEIYVNRRVEIWAGNARFFTMPTSSLRFGIGLSWGRPR